MSKKNEDLHIALLKFGKDHLEFGVTFQQLQEHIKERGFDVGERRLKSYFVENYESLEVNAIARGSPMQAADESSKFSLTVDSTFRLIEHEEFKSANRSSRIATYFATAALFVSIVAASVSPVPGARSTFQAYDQLRLQLLPLPYRTLLAAQAQPPTNYASWQCDENKNQHDQLIYRNPHGGDVCVANC